MCGRYESAINYEELDEIFSKYIGKLHIDYDIDEVLKEEDIAPTDRVRVIIKENGEYKLKVMKWAIKSKIPDPKKQAAGKRGDDAMMPKDFFNNRIETIKTSNVWKEMYQNNRCLFPMTAFYEWPKIPGTKPIQKRISMKDHRIFFAGGIFTDKDLIEQQGASIITTEPNEFVRSYHNRMPLLFSADEAKAFMELPPEGVSTVCKPLDDSFKMQIETAQIIKPEKVVEPKPESKTTGTKKTTKSKKPPQDNIEYDLFGS